MAHTDFEKIFSRFREKFPPAESPREFDIKLTTEELLKTIKGLHPEVSFPDNGIYPYMVEQGYSYEPEDFNDHITFYWLLKRL